MPMQKLLDDRHHPPTQWAAFNVDPQKCNGCLKCVQTCPAQSLYLKDGVPVHRFDTGESEVGCIGCRNCYAACAEGAIEVRGHYQVEEGYYASLLGPPTFPNPLGAPEPPPFEAMAPELTPVERVVYTRRSVRLFKKKKAVSDEMLRRLVEAGRFAPSQGNGQPWSFLVITDRAVLDRMGGAIKKMLAPVSAMYVNRAGTHGRLKKLAVNVLARLTPNNFDQRLAHGMDTLVANDSWDVFLHAPALIVVLGDRRGISEPVIDCTLCAHNMVLVAHSLGLGTCYVGFTKLLNASPALKRELGIEWPWRIYTSIAVGWPRGEIDRAVARERPLVRWIAAGATPRREE